MQIKRSNVFETNSSSTHTLVCKSHNEQDYLPMSNKVIIRFINTDEDCVLHTLRDKVSYLASHIINHYKWDCEDYEDLVEQVSDDYDFRRLKDYVLRHYNKEVVFPKTYKGQLEDIVTINHQLLASNMTDVLEELVAGDRDYLADVLAPHNIIEIGHD